MEYRQNDQLQLASEIIQFTGRSLFLTGKAGTGKTTFLHNLRRITPKRLVVVAPTGVAAINAGGVTLHSFFQLGFGPAIPGQEAQGTQGGRSDDYRKKFNREKIALLKCLDLLVIDEVSMVRADVMDAVDGVLRRYRDHTKPFGGVQVLMIGDLHQLSPVAREEEWNLLRHYYASPYFFDSHVLKEVMPVVIELQEIFRQTDEHFIQLLNNVRENEIGQETIAELNSRFQPGFRPTDDEGYITLTTHNAQAGNINQERLSLLPGSGKRFKAAIEGDFPPGNFPTDEELVLKIGAQVMMNRNDASPAKRYYNGKIGRITRMTGEAVFVLSPGESDEIEITPVTWENMKYSVNDTTREIREEVAGTFTQLPLRLAWAITIHKSQGLTFSKVIIDAKAAFAYGQVYVALSRCRTFHGIVLSTPIGVSGIRTSALVQSYAELARKNVPDPERVAVWKSGYQKELLLDLFHFGQASNRFRYLLKLVLDFRDGLEPNAGEHLESLLRQSETEIFSVAERFKAQLDGLIKPGLMPEDDPVLQERVKQAAGYFASKLGPLYAQSLSTLHYAHDSRETARLLEESLEKLQKEIWMRFTCIQACRNGFTAQAFLQARSKADLDFRAPRKLKAVASDASPTGETNRDLYKTLRTWRTNHARELGVPDYMVLPNKALLDLATTVPRNLRELKTVRGIGKARIREYGTELLEILRSGTGGVEEPAPQEQEKPTEKTARKRTKNG